MGDASVFISYSHKDERWKDRLVRHLDVLQRQGLLTIWDDRRIGVGEQWLSKIKEALNAARVAIMLISADYLTSEFILSEEVKDILRRRSEEGLVVVPVIIKSCTWKEVDWLRSMQVRPTDGKPLASLVGDKRDAALSAVATEVADLLKSVGHEGEGRRRPRPDPGDGRSRFRRAIDNLVDRLGEPIDFEGERREMLDEVRRVWIEGRLKDMSGPIGVPFSIRVSVREEPGVSALAHMRPDVDVYTHFVKSDYRMAILGEAGTGKTYKLLQLARELIEHAPDDPAERIPVVFNLSSWADWASREESMHDWLIAQLKSFYGRSDKLARFWVGSGQLVLLLDGLDEITAGGVEPGPLGKEVAEESKACRRKCLDELNYYISATGAEVALCCRADEYDALGVTLDLRRDDATVEVLPLTDDDVRNSLRDAGPKLKSLREAVETDPELREMARTPFLLKAMATVYRQTPELTARAIIESGRGDEGARRLELMDKYVKALPTLAKKKYAASTSRAAEPGLLTRYELKDIKFYLSNIAEKMQQGDSRLFFVDQLQPNRIWLNESGRRLYLALVSLFLFLFLWLMIALPAGWAIGYEGSASAAPTFERLLHFNFGAMFLTALYCCGLVAVGFSLTKGWGFGVVCGIALGVGRAIARYEGGDTAESWLAQGAASAALGVVALVPAVYLSCHERDRIRLLQRSKLHPLQALLGVATAVIVGGVLALILGQMRDARFGIARGLSFGSALIPILALSYGYLSSSHEVKTSTDQGLRHSAYFALWSLVACSLLGSACFGAIYGKLLTRDDGVTNAILGASLGSLSLLFGGMPVLQHQGLRSILHRKRLVPRELVEFLNVATKLNLLRPVGGGHMFEHEFLREYFLKIRGHLLR